jgi:hypothetical protein
MQPSAAEINLRFAAIPFDIGEFASLSSPIQPAFIRIA